MGKVLSRVMLPGVLAQIGHVTPVRPKDADGLVARVYAQAEREFGMLAPPLILHSPAPEPLAAAWAMLRESLLAAGTVGRSVKEAVATAVSAGNACPYCVDVHRATMDGLAPGRPASRVDGDHIETIGDPALRRVAAWAASNAPGAAPLDPHAPPEAARELAAVAVTFHYLNRMVNVFLGESPLPPQLPARARGTAMRLFGLVMRPAARRAAAPGASLVLLPPAPPAADLAWADGAPFVAGAFSRAAAAFEQAGRRSVPEPVRELVAAELAGWNGAPRGPSRAWVNDAIAALPPGLHPAGRLALLTALASYQVDASVIAGFRAETPGDRALVELTSWSAFTAARHIGGRLRIAPPPSAAAGAVAGDPPRDAVTT
ncbi:alkyl hydroperoxide reductase AhpD [Sphaerisporangium melleum]|uniref:Alkyl hydroperoxide reductase AhpD n=1 Tax=Sphaerisporangium melleum TaxID=321316 RepID=A0A917R6H4_9ACTN|nr:carboxymuconolactone decarboxylase family protein [Sphaerisporangium melleum]GGK91159.1 alkyl hydroperoxide reductase AhpD [Sphaerisporangium melleum]GII72768.1 alkyl hydroperoxide reductase AhpD [Sphaerisporangium melleum]